MLFNVTVPIEDVFFIAKITSIFYNLTFCFGLFGNLMIIAATIKCRQLHNPCNVLIAFQAFTDLLLGFGHPPYLYYAYAKIQIPFSKCYFIQIISFAGMNVSIIMVLFIGVDRVLAVRFIVFYKLKNSYVYVLSVIAVALIYSSALNVLAYYTLTDELTVCLVPEGYTGLGKQVAFSSHLLLNVLVLIVYSYLNTTVASIQSSQNRKMIKSLRSVVLCTVFGWFITFLICNTAMVISSDKNWLLAADMIAGFFACTHVAIPFIVYYMKSSVYRTAFRSLINIALLPSLDSTVSQALPSVYAPQGATSSITKNINA